MTVEATQAHKLDLQEAKKPANLVKYLRAQGQYAFSSPYRPGRWIPDEACLLAANRIEELEAKLSEVDTVVAYMQTATKALRISVQELLERVAASEES